MTVDRMPHRRLLRVWALRYIPGSHLARLHPETPRGWFTSRAQAERVRAACPNAGDIEVVRLEREDEP